MTHSLRPFSKRAEALQVPLYSAPHPPPAARHPGILWGISRRTYRPAAAAGWGWHIETADTNVLSASSYGRRPSTAIPASTGEFGPFRR